MTTTLTVIGNRAGSPGPDGPASGYVLRTPTGSLLLDCGPGVVAGLATRGLIPDIDGIVITHRHADHSLDLTALAYHRAFPVVQPAIPLVGPTGIADYVAELDAAHGIPTLDSLRTPSGTQFDISEVVPGESFELAGVRVDTVEAKHPVPCLSLRFPDCGLVYSSDTAKTDDLVELSRDARLLLAEATYVSAEGHDFDAHGHMSGFEAGELAAESGARRLVLTHMEDFALADETVVNATSRYDGPIDVAWVGTTYHL